MRLRWLTIVALAVVDFAGPRPALAQQPVPPRDRQPAERRPAPPDSNGPREAPPPPRAERSGQRAGFVWISGEWDWRGGKYEWIPGHWERERAGKRWRPARWEQRGDVYTRTPGDWEDGGAAPPPVANDDRPRQAPPPPRPEKQDRPRAGFVWIAGEWDWRGGKYEWVPGHWERERANKRWRPSRWEQRDGAYTRTPGDWEDGGGPPVANDDRPRQPPPPPRSETQDPPRAGFVWIAGEWDWRGGKYEWIPGHWERERAGKRWRPSRWEQRDGAYARTPGDWEDGGAHSPTRPPITRPRPPRRDWRIERALVSSYWPAKGKPGTRIVIRGRNFPNNATVLWGGKEIRGVKVTADGLRFVVPPDATTGLIAIDVGRGRPLAVGNFEVAPAFDAEAERRRVEAEARKKAEADWAERKRRLAKDRAAREAAVRQRHEQRVAQREQRRADRLAEIQQRYARAFLADEETQDEMNLHAQRVAELERMADIAEIRDDAKLAVRIEMLRAREDQRHDQRMAALDAAFRAGGAP